MVTDARLHGKSQKKAKLFHEMLFLLQFSHKYTVRKKSVNDTSAPPECLGNCRSVPLVFWMSMIQLMARIFSNVTSWLNLKNSLGGNMISWMSNTIDNHCRLILLYHPILLLSVNRLHKTIVPFGSRYI